MARVILIKRGLVQLPLVYGPFKTTEQALKYIRVELTKYPSENIEITTIKK